MTLADIIRRRQAFLALSNSDQWSEDEACRLFGLVPGSLNADGIFDMAAKDAEEIADAVVPLLTQAVHALEKVRSFGSSGLDDDRCNVSYFVEKALKATEFVDTSAYDDDRR